MNKHRSMICFLTPQQLQDRKRINNGRSSSSHHTSLSSNSTPKSPIHTCLYPMAPSALFALQSPPLCFSFCATKFSATTPTLQSLCRNPTTTACMASASALAPPSTGLGFKNLMETFTVDVHRAEGRELNVPLIAPFTIASSRLERVENVAIRIELRNGCVGWGESPILPHVTAEDQTTALAKAAEACLFLKQSSGKTLCLVLDEINAMLPGHSFASVRCKEISLSLSLLSFCFLL